MESLSLARDRESLATPVGFAAIAAPMSGRGVPQTWLDIAACTWLVVRVLYTGAYLANLGRVRPALWALSVLTSTGIIILPA